VRSSSCMMSAILASARAFSREIFLYISINAYHHDAYAASLGTGDSA
jgi:hypothetical protein